MKRLICLAIGAFTFVLLSGIHIAEARMYKVYGPVYIVSEKGNEKEVELKFPVRYPGPGKIVVKNNGDCRKKAEKKRHKKHKKHSKKEHKHGYTSVEIEFNDRDVARSRDFKKNVEVMEYDVTLLTENELAVEVRSHRGCELEITIMGEVAAPPAPVPTPAPTAQEVLQQYGRTPL